MKITYLFSIYCCLFVFVANAQEGIWPVEKLPQIKEKLIDAGLKLDLREIYREKEDRSVVKTSTFSLKLKRIIEIPFESKICLNEAVFDIPSGNAALCSSTGLAIGVMDYSEIPDSILERIDPLTGVWVAKQNGAYILPDFFAKSLAFTFDLNKFGLDDNTISPNILHRYYSQRELLKQRLEEKYADIVYLNYTGDYYYRHDEAVGTRTLSKEFTDVRLVALIEDEELSKSSDHLIAIFRIYSDRYNQPISVDQDTTQGYFNPHFLPIGSEFPSDSFHLVLGYPDESYFNLNSFILDYDFKFASFFQQFYKKIITRIPEANQILNCDCEEEDVLKKAIEHQRFIENLFKNSMERDPKWRQEYGELLPLMKETNEKQVKMIPGLFYTTALLANETGFIQMFDLAKEYLKQEKITALEEEIFMEKWENNQQEIFNQELWAVLFELYFTQVPVEHISPFAKQQLAVYRNDYQSFVRDIFVKSTFLDTINIVKSLKQNFPRGLEKVAIDPAYILLDSISRYFRKHVQVPAINNERFANHYNELFLQAMNVVLHRKPLYPDADRSLRISYGKLQSSNITNYYLSNAHLLPSHIGSPVINNQGQILGIVGSFYTENYFNMYNFDLQKSKSTIIPIQHILGLLGQHADGKWLVNEIGK